MSRAKLKTQADLGQSQDVTISLALSDWLTILDALGTPKAEYGDCSQEQFLELEQRLGHAVYNYDNETILESQREYIPIDGVSRHILGHALELYASHTLPMLASSLARRRETTLAALRALLRAGNAPRLTQA